MRRSGFTLLELLIALVLVAVIASIAIPAYFSQSTVTLENAAVLLAKDLRAAQNRAAYLGEATRIEFMADGDGYLVLDALDEPITDPRNELPFRRRYSIDAVFRGVKITDVKLDGGSVLVFDERGEPHSNALVTLRFGADQRVVSLTLPYGEVDIIGSTSGWVDLGY